jgi:glycosyltransferase involved in cell wall biosynthesis
MASLTAALSVTFLSTLSVVIPTYNRRGTLHRCLASVYAQTAPVDEVIVVDDGSTDGTAQWLSEAFPEAKLIRQDNQGVSAARNAGIRSAHSEWIALLDSDDCWLPEKIAKQMEALRQNRSYLICHTEEKWIYRGKSKNVPSHYLKKGGAMFQHCLARCAISPSTVLIRRSLFDEVGNFDESFLICEDYELWLRITAKHPVLLVNEALIEKHGGNPDQLSATRNLDVYRIQALEKLLANPRLDSDCAAKAIDALIQKCEIVASGFSKKGIESQAMNYLAISSRYRAGGSI